MSGILETIGISGFTLGMIAYVVIAYICCFIFLRLQNALDEQILAGLVLLLSPLWFPFLIFAGLLYGLGFLVIGDN